MSSNLHLTPLRLRNGVWDCNITQTDSGVPQVEVRYLDKVVETVKLSETSDAKVWKLTMTIPPHAISDGVQSFLVIDKLADEKIGQLTLIAGEDIGHDLRAEVDLLRAELDMLKRAFRRHCVQTT